jgi:hypothetical protein
MGILEGVWKCHSCREKFWGTSPKVCPKCGAKLTWEFVTFKEIPFYSKYIKGHSDGILNFNPMGIPLRLMLELKSIKNILDKSASKHTYGFESLEQPLEEHDLQLQLYLNEWGMKVQESTSKETIIIRDNGSRERLDNNSPDMVGAREVGPLTNGLVMYVGKNNGEIKTYVTKFNRLKIKFLGESMSKIFEAVSTGDIDSMNALCYDKECQKKCKFGNLCKES